MSRDSTKSRFAIGIALAVWLAWAGLIAWSWIALQNRDWNPHPLPLLVLLLVMGVGQVLLFAMAFGALLRRRARRAALSALCIGTVPAWLLLAQVGYVLLNRVQLLAVVNPITNVGSAGHGRVRRTLRDHSLQRADGRAAGHHVS